MNIYVMEKSLINLINKQCRAKFQKIISKFLPFFNHFNSITNSTCLSIFFSFTMEIEKSLSSIFPQLSLHHVQVTLIFFPNKITQLSLYTMHQSFHPKCVYPWEVSSLKAIKLKLKFNTYLIWQRVPTTPLWNVKWILPTPLICTFSLFPATISIKFSFFFNCSK